MIDNREDEFERLRAIPFNGLLADEAKPDLEGDGTSTQLVGASNQSEAEASAPLRTGAVYGPTVDAPFPLRHPFSIDGTRYDALFFRPPAFEDVEAVLKGEMTELDMHARMADVPVAVLRALRWVDSEIASFVARSLAPEMIRRR